MELLGGGADEGDRRSSGDGGHWWSYGETELEGEGETETARPRRGVV